jgi:hypothetical protein
MKILVRCFAASLLVVVGSRPANALNVTVETTPAGSHFLLLSGRFESSDDVLEVERLVRTRQLGAVSFDSHGGNIYTAMEVGRLIRRMGLRTAQLRIGDCISACALAFLGGVKRYAEPGSIGVHRSSFAPDASLSVEEAVAAVQQGTADVLTYIVEMGADPSLLALSLSYDSSDVRYLSGNEMAELGVTTEPPPPQSTVATNPPAADAPASGQDASAGDGAPSEMEAPGLTFFRAVKEELPQEFKVLVREVLAAGEDNAETRRRYFAFVADLRARYASDIFRAPDDVVSAAIRTNLDFLRVVEERESADVCAQFMLWGPTVLNLEDPLYRRWVDKLETALVRAFGAALRSPDPVGRASNNDWLEAVADFRGTPDQYRLVVGNDAANAGYCKAAVLFVEAVMRSPGPGGRRARAELVYNVASSNQGDGR